MRVLLALANLVVAMALVFAILLAFGWADTYNGRLEDYLAAAAFSAFLLIGVGASAMNALALFASPRGDAFRYTFHVANIAFPAAMLALPVMDVMSFPHEGGGQTAILLANPVWLAAIVATLCIAGGYLTARRTFRRRGAS